MEYEPGFLRGFSHGIGMGSDPLGVVYSIVTQDYDSTPGGSDYNQEAQERQVQYISGKLVGLGTGLLANVATYGFLQACALASNVGIARSKHKVSKNILSTQKQD